MAKLTLIVHIVNEAMQSAVNALSIDMLFQYTRRVKELNCCVHSCKIFLCCRLLKPTNVKPTMLKEELLSGTTDKRKW